VSRRPARGASVLKETGRLTSPPCSVPVVFPGFSVRIVREPSAGPPSVSLTLSASFSQWLNLKGGPRNEIPRAGGRLLWRQIHNAQRAGDRESMI